MFEIAVSVRREKADHHPNHKGKSRSYSKRLPDHVYLLQGLLMCAHCGHPMSPHYVFHKAGYGRRKDSFICHYVCARYKKYDKDCDHANRVLAPKAEAWMIERISGLLKRPHIIEEALQKARENCLKGLQPQREALGHAQAALRQNQAEIDKLVITITGGGIATELLGFLNQRAKELKMSREQLLREQRRLQQEVAPAEQAVDAQSLQSSLADFGKLAQVAEPQELQKVMRLTLKRVEWGNDGKHKVQFYSLPLNARVPNSIKNHLSANQQSSVSNSQQENRTEDHWFDLHRWSDASGRGRTDTLLPELDFESSASANSATEAFSTFCDWQGEILAVRGALCNLAGAIF